MVRNVIDMFEKVKAACESAALGSLVIMRETELHKDLRGGSREWRGKRLMDSSKSQRRSRPTQAELQRYLSTLLGSVKRKKTAEKPSDE